MSSVAVSELWRRLRASRLVPEAWLEASAGVVGSVNDPAEVVQRLTDLGVLTAFQAAEVAAGRESRCVIGGKYVVRELLGRGGMGAVYLCEHATLRTLVAVKVVPITAGEAPDVRERFYREARAFATLRHPNLVRGFDVDRDGDRDFIVMEYVEGIDLHELVARAGPLAIPRAVNYVRQAAVGLAYAHEQGWVHRDIKPGNLAVDRGGVVRVLDMGLARRLFEGTDAITENFDDGLVRGTADYIAPEQAEGVAVDNRADVYSLGLSLFYLLVGRPVFGGMNTAQKLVAHLTRTMPDLGSVRADIPSALAGVFARMTARDRFARFPSAAAVADALVEWDTGGPYPPTEADIPVRVASPAPTTPRRSDQRARHVALQPSQPTTDEVTVSLGPPFRRPPVRGRGTWYWVRAAGLAAALLAVAITVAAIVTDDPRPDRDPQPPRPAPTVTPFVGDYVTVTRAHGPGQMLFGNDPSYLTRPVFLSVAEAIAHLAKDPRPGVRILLLDEYHQEPAVDVRLPSDVVIESARAETPTVWLPVAGNAGTTLVQLTGGERVTVRNLRLNAAERVETGLRWDRPGPGCAIEAVHISRFTRYGVAIRSAGGTEERPVGLNRVTVAPDTGRPVESCVRLTGDASRPTGNVHARECLFVSGGGDGVAVHGPVERLLLERCRWFGLVNGVRFAEDGAVSAEVVGSTFAKVGTGVAVGPRPAGTGFCSLTFTANLFFDTGLPFRDDTLRPADRPVIRSADNWSGAADTPDPKGAGVLPRAENLVIGLDPTAEREFLRYPPESRLATAAGGSAVGAPPVANR